MVLISTVIHQQVGGGGTIVFVGDKNHTDEKTRGPRTNEKIQRAGPVHLANVIMVSTMPMINNGTGTHVDAAINIIAANGIIPMTNNNALSIIDLLSP